MRIVPRFPARIQASDGVRVDRTGGVVTIRQDWNSIAQEPAPSDPTTYELLLRGPDGGLARVPGTPLVPVSWSTLSGKPTEFPPEAHTHGIPDVTNLQTALDAKVNTSATIDVAHGGSGRTSATAYAVVCGGTTGAGAHQSVASLGASGDVLTSNGAGALPTFQTPPGLTGAVRYDIAQALSSGQQAQARSNMAAIPQPQTAAGVGQRLKIAPPADNGYNLPAGGTWEWWVLRFAVTGNVYNGVFLTGVDAGGTNVAPSTTGSYYLGIARRVL
jgi:hypothetical protein